jgi:predicted alpha/beta superfamily hydrolase
MPQPETRVVNPTPTIVTDLPSKLVQQDYRLFISLPKGYPDSSHAYPTIYVLDGNCLFTFVRDIAEMLKLSGQVPDVIVVGIGYPRDTYLDTLTLRGRDLTFQELTEEYKKNHSSYPYGETGGGSRFLEVIRTELLPFVEQNYRVDANDRMLLGWSAGAGFCLFAMFRYPELFRRLAAISPWFKEDLLQEEAHHAAAHAALGAKLFIAQEQPDKEWLAASTRKDPTADLHGFVDILRLRRYAGFQVHKKIYEEENHSSVVPIAITHALRELYR